MPRDKIVPVERLGSIAAEARQAGHAVVLCHGVFDLLHMGHVRHLEAARRYGDILIVTITADLFVNKGPGRPVFNQQLRAELLSALEYVDYVGINHAADAVTIIRSVRPTTYVKGSDYENSDADVTGKIALEREAVEQNGGKLVFTDGITFSSSHIINRYLDVFDPPLRDFLGSVRAGGGEGQILSLIESVSRLSVLLVGDTIIDEYQYVSDLGKPSKEHIIASLHEGGEIFAGGIIATANHVAEFCREVNVVTTLGADCPYEELIRKSLKSNVKLHAVRIAGRPTTRKVRYINKILYMRKLFEVYFMNDQPLPEHQAAEVAAEVSVMAPAADVVMVNDFGHGMINSSLVSVIREKSRFLGVNAQTNAGNHGYNLVTKYKNADYVCIDAPEARLASGDKFGNINTIVGSVLPGLIACKQAIVTHGPHGCYTYTPGQEVARIPAFTNQVIDTVGAGDAFFAVTAPLVSAGGRLSDVGFVGNATGALKVAIVGHRKSVEKVSLIKFVVTLLK